MNSKPLTQSELDSDALELAERNAAKLRRYEIMEDDLACVKDNNATLRKDNSAMARDIDKLTDELNDADKLIMTCACGQTPHLHSDVRLTDVKWSVRCPCLLSFGPMPYRLNAIQGWNAIQLSIPSIKDKRK